MPSYVQPPATPPLLIPGWPGYSAGSRASNNPTARLQVTKSAVAANVVTLTVLVTEGFIPAVGATAYVNGTSNNAAALNQPNGVALTGVTIDSTTGIGTITYSLTTGNLAPTADNGVVSVPPPEVGDALTTNTKFQQFAVQQPSGFPQSGRSVSWTTVIGGGPAAATVNLQGALVDIDSEYSTLDSSTSTTGETRVSVGINLPFLRLTAGTITGGTNPTLVGKILV